MGPSQLLEPHLAASSPQKLPASPAPSPGASLEPQKASRCLHKRTGAQMSVPTPDPLGRQRLLEAHQGPTIELCSEQLGAQHSKLPGPFKICQGLDRLRALRTVRGRC